MADFTDKDKQLLDKLGKSFERTAKTTDTREPWQEHFDHDTSLNANRASLAAKIIEGFSGSWAAQYNYGLGSAISPTGVLAPAEVLQPLDPNGPPISVRAKTSKIGLRGVPEINFAPFNWYTNSFGRKGPSLIGHPISFEIIGPTLKSQFCNWTWDVVAGGGPNGGDLLTMGPRPNGGGATVFTLLGGYNIVDFTIGDALEPNGGLYIVITDDGANPGSIPAGATPMGALPLFVDTARYEVFRVSAVSGTSLEVHPNKSLGNFFDLVLPSPRTIRAITILKPYVTRIQAIPQTGAGVGREQVFAIVTPEFAASSDLYPPYDNFPLGVGTWISGGFTELTAPGSLAATGAPIAYGGNSTLPIPIPIQEAVGFVDKDPAALPTTLVGQQFIETDITPYGIGQNPKIIRITNTQREDDLPALTFGTMESCFGWFPVQEVIVGPTPGIRVGRVAEVDPQTGLVFYGPGPYISSAAVTQRVSLGFTIHEPISSLWASGTAFNIDKVEASRLKNLIDPRWVGRFEKQVSDPTLLGGQPAPPAGSGPGRPDKAIFDTATTGGVVAIPEAADPGNLENLGFRIVLFPAKEVAGRAIPDFDKPITSREIIIDPTIMEKQTVEFDYSAGLVRLSHPPPERVAAGDIVPNGIVGSVTNNTRTEVVLFAACVPYSMEDSQLGAGTRVTSDEGGISQTDVYGHEVTELIMDAAQNGGVGTTWSAVAPHIGFSSFGSVEIVLTDLWEGPATGVIVITSGSDASFSYGRWGYTQIDTRVLASGKTVTALGGISSVPGVFNPTPLVGQHRRVILRREVVFGEESFSLPAITDFYPSDTTYGSSQRTETLRFNNAKLEPQLDGSVLVNPQPDFSLFDRPWGSAMPSKLEYPIATPAVAAVNNFLSEDGILTGLDYQISPTDPVFPTIRGPFWSAIETGLPSMRFSAGTLGFDNWHGVITRGGGPFVFDGSRGILHTTDNFRQTVKFSYHRRHAGTIGTVFMGFVQGPLAAPDPSVGNPLTGYTLGTAMAPGYHAIGLLLDQASPSGDQFMFWARGTGGDFLFPTGVFAPSVIPPISTIGPFYFVMEYKRVPDLRVSLTTVQFIGTTEVRMALYDQRQRCIASTVVTQSDRQPAPGPGSQGLFWGFGMRSYTVAASSAQLFFHGASIIVDASLPRIGPIPPFPPL